MKRASQPSGDQPQQGGVYNQRHNITINPTAASRCSAAAGYRARSAAEAHQLMSKLSANPGQVTVGRDGFPSGFSAAHQQARVTCRSELEDVVVVGEVSYTRARHSLSFHAAGRRGSGATRRPSDHGLSQAGGRPLALGPGCPDVVPGGGAEVVRCEARRTRRCNLTRRACRLSQGYSSPRPPGR